MPNFENAFNTVCELVKDFKENEHRYLSPQYQEAEVRRDFIDKLFEALGWDVYHRTQKNPYEQEVKVEKGVSIGKAQKRADYAFYITPEYRQPKFFAEAKKPSRSLKNADDYFQTIRYGWNSNTPIAVLSDFEEFHILDCRYKPNLKTVLYNPNHKSYRYADYTNKEIFKEIYYLFSRDDVEKNSLEKYSEAFAKIKGKGKTTFKSIIKTIDDDFLEYIDEVRETLAKAFKKNDSKLSSEELTEATQRTIDRIVFIRFLEDKLIEPEYYISEFGKKGNAWNEFISVCRKLDAKYNGIVFKKHFIDEQNFQGPEQNTFKKICDEMSYLNSPYDFNAIPIHILGSIYERFLGKVVNATAQRVKVEEKPEVRKAGGVYYTPKYIVDYIVENTVGKIITNKESSGRSGILPDDSLKDCPTGKIGKTPAEISKLRFADIACGSGSFLIGVFETLLKYHTEYYQLHPEQAKKDGCINKDGLWILSIKQKQNILLNNIFGVDIDNQAVEVTQLSLALKMLEDETGGTANDMQNMFHEKILPDLSKNIICGNSLIGTDIVYDESSEAGLFERKRRITPEEERKLNPMDFDNRFFEIMVKGGFDAIVGNPPYVRQEQLGGIKEYLTTHYEVFIGMADLYSYFIEKGIKLLNNNGVFGYIVANKWMRANYGKNLREFLLKYNLKQIIDFGDLPVFENATTYPCILLVYKSGNDLNGKTDYVNVRSLDFPSLNTYVDLNIQLISKQFLDNNIWNLVSDVESSLINKLNKTGIPLAEYVNKKILFGIKTGLNEAFIVDTKIKDELIAKDKNSEFILKPLLLGKDIRKYSPSSVEKYLIFFPKGFTNTKGNKPKDAWKWLSDNYTAIAEYLKPFERKGKLRYDRGDYWWELRSCDYYSEFEKSKILWGNLCNQSPFTIDYTNSYVNAPSVVIPLNDLYLLGLMNSKISWYILKLNAAERQGGFIEAKPVYVSKLPIKKLDLSNETEKQSHDKIVSLVNEMLESKKQLQTVKTDRDKIYYENKCSDLDDAIDSEVYKLYGLTEEEIKIVEGKG